MMRTCLDCGHEHECHIEPEQPTNVMTRLTVSAVFQTWVVSTGRTRTVLTDKRRRLIERALRDYSLDDISKAVMGWQHSPFHRGENPQGRIYNNLELILRDAEHIEMFRDLTEGTLITTPANGTAQRFRSAAEEFLGRPR